MWLPINIRKLWPRGIRSRMMLLTFLSTAIIFVLSHFLIYLMLSNQLIDIVDHELAEEVIEYEQAVRDKNILDENVLLKFSEKYFNEHVKEGAMQAKRLMVLMLPEQFVGNNVKAADFINAKKISNDINQYGAYTASSKKNEQARIISTSISINGRRVGRLIMAETLKPINNILLTTLISLGSSMVIAMLVVILVGYQISKRILSPVARMAHVAEVITKEDLSERINYEGPDDEVCRLAQTFDAMVDRLESAFIEKKQFISDASHELRTPITIIKGHLEVLKLIKDPSKQDYQEALFVVLDELERMNRMVNNLLMLARSSASDFLLYDDIELPKFLETIHNKADKLASRNWLLAEVPDVIITADRDRLTEVLLNLLQNAAEHTSDTSDKIKLSANIEDLWVKIEVSDSGDGIPEEELDNIFKRFYRVDKARSKSVGGVGLGLSLVQAIVNAHDGKVEVASGHGQGSTFSIYLPFNSCKVKTRVKVR